jgi:hypothetical protein
MNYKAPDNSLHVIEPEYAHLLPVGAVQITDEEAEALRLAAIPAPVPPTTQEKLAQLDADNTLTQRNLRNTIILMAEAFKSVTGGAVDLSAIPGVAKVYAVEAEAAALRAQL